ncbi:hypothetical protein HNQ56_004397 [Anaerotaenia torta]|uniref:hypothetical protein n=1 Tax=Anaerotaenia torta TaxID=433293 RepID=UPI003D1D4D5C
MSGAAKDIAPSIRKLLAVMPLDALKETECSFLQGMNRKGIDTPACQLFLQDVRKEQARRQEVQP